jgi:hypothetical protein
MADTIDLLKKIVAETKCKPGWSFNVAQGEGSSWILIISILEDDNYKPGQLLKVGHCHPIPTTSFNEKSWRRWILEQCLRTMNHEIGESLRFGKEEIRPFAPMHGPGEDPYTIHEWRSEQDALTTQDGSLREGPV